MSLMFPTIFVLGLGGLGPTTEMGGSLIVMAIVGTTVLTPVTAVKNHTATMFFGVECCAKDGERSQGIGAAGAGRLDTLAYSEANKSLSGYCSVNSRNNFRARAA